MKNLQRIEFEAHYCENIKSYAKRAVDYLAEQKKKCQDLELYLICTFNKHKVITTKYSTVDSIVSDYHAQLDNSDYEYRQTTEFKEKMEAREKELKELNEKARDMMVKFEKINKRNKLDLINWLEEFQPLADHVGVTYDRCLLISELQKAGYIAGMNCKRDNTMQSTSDEYADWLIGQCLEWLEEYMTIPQSVPKFAEEYRNMVR